MIHYHKLLCYTTVYFYFVLLSTSTNEDSNVWRERFCIVYATLVFTPRCSRRGLFGCWCWLGVHSKVLLCATMVACVQHAFCRPCLCQSFPFRPNPVYPLFLLCFRNSPHRTRFPGHKESRTFFTEQRVVMVQTLPVRLYSRNCALWNVTQTSFFVTIHASI